LEVETPEKKSPNIQSHISNILKAEPASVFGGLQAFSLTFMSDLSRPGSANSNDTFNISESLVPPREIKAAGQSHVSFNGLLQKPLLLKEDLKEGCGGQLWPAGMVLAKYLLRRHNSTLVNKTMSVFPSPSYYRSVSQFER